MTTRDLGVLDGPVLVFGGPYGNLPATRAVLAAAERRGIPAARTICTGDVAAYCAEPQACVDLLRARGIPVVMGNCEEQLAEDAPDCGCGFEDGTACAVLSSGWYGYCRTAIDQDAKAWMGRLPRRITFILGGRRFSVLHGGVALINRFIFESEPARSVEAELDAAGTHGVIGGHCGLPFARLVGDRLWHNAGAIGMPANDGTARVWYSTLAPRADGIMVELHPLEYDFRAAAGRMRRARLPEAYAAALETGLWPSCDVLPSAERARRGRPLEPRALLWPRALDRRRPAASLDKPAPAPKIPAESLG